MYIDVDIINELLVDIFNNILNIEQKSIQYIRFKDISISEVHTIAAIGIYKPKKMTQVADKLDITLGTLTIAISHLVKKEYVIRKKSNIDRRIVYISLTEKGKIVYKIHEKFHEDMVSECLKGLNSNEKEVLTKSLGKLNKFFKSRYNIKYLDKNRYQEGGRDE